MWLTNETAVHYVLFSAFHPDLVWNQQISMKVLQAGSVCWALYDQGQLTVGWFAC
jgi:hypothetical protein